MSKVILAVHGLANKPPADTLQAWWSSALLEGLSVNRGMAPASLPLQLVYWADVLYPAPDTAPDVYQPAPPGALRRYAESWRDTLRLAARSVGEDMLDVTKRFFGIGALADVILRTQLTDLYRYYTDALVRDALRARLTEALVAHRGATIMLLAHSMGSIIAYDVLRLLGQQEAAPVVTHFVTLGSPLGLPHVKYRIAQENLLIRTPSVVRQWTNLADRRDPVAVDMHLADDYEANDRGVRVTDTLVLNDWGLIHHQAYGYLRTPECTDVVRGFL